MGFGAYDESEQEKQDVHLNTAEDVEVDDTRTTETGDVEFETGDTESLLNQYKQLAGESDSR